VSAVVVVMVAVAVAVVAASVGGRLDVNQQQVG
jgi:hypothetical protein